MIGDSQDYLHDIAVSFAGEDRDYVDELVRELKSRGVSVFYDSDFESDLWGKNLINHFKEVYSDRARFFVPFVSSNYIKKNWTRIELQSAQERAFNHPDDDYILPIKLDETELPGFPSTFGYITWQNKSVEEISVLLIKKLGRDKGSQEKTSSFSFPQIEMPPRKVNFTDLDYRMASRKSLKEIAEYFQEGLKQISNSHPEIETDFDQVNSGKFIASLFRDGELKNEIKVFMGGLGRSDRTIGFATGRPVDRDRDNSFNGTIQIKEVDGELVMKFEAFGSIPTFGDQGKETDDTCALIWREFIAPLTYR